MDKAALENYGASPAMVGIALVASLLIGTLLLTAVVRWSEGFFISFWRALLLTAVSVLAAIGTQLLVFAVLFWLGYASMGAYWFGLALTTLIASLVYIAIYAYGVRRPDGRRIGVLRALKVSLIQLAASIAVAFVLAFVLAILIVNGVIALPELPPDLRIPMR